MERVRRPGVPASSRLTVRSKKNRRRPGSVWSRLPKPAVAADACGRALRRSLPALAAAGSLTAVGTGLFLGYRWVTTSPRFAITAIDVRGAEHLAAEDVLAAIPARVGSNIFRTDLDTVERALAKHPWIDTIEVRRELPHTLVIDIHEHTAAAVARVDSGETYLVDDAGAPFKRAQLAGPGATSDAADMAGLPVVSGLPRTAFQRDPAGTRTAITTALAALAVWSAGADRPTVAEVQIDATGALTLRTADGAATVQLGVVDDIAELPARLHAFDATWSSLADAERARVRTIHLDASTDLVPVPAHVIVAFKN